MPALSLPPLGLYVHIPWCVRKCPYCDFNSHAAPEILPEAEYLATLLEDLQRDAPMARGRQIGSVFFGGGTPSLFSAAAIGRILKAADDAIGLAADAEITLEANPGTAEQARFADYRRAGVNRLSIGIQSLNDRQLQALGRIHSRDEALGAVAMAREAGFENFNLDLMHGLPAQSVEDALADLRAVLALEPSHVSWYQLTIEPNTAFYRRPPELPGTEVLADIEDAGFELLQATGYARYEISAYARGGRESRHNRNYWEFGDYLGIGAGAHGKVSDPASGQVLRSRKTRLPAHYIAADLLNSHWQPVAAAELPLEFMMNALRLHEGVSSESFVARSGLPLSSLEPALSQLRARELLVADEGLLCCTPLGRRFLNDVLAEFMSDEA